MSCLTRDDALWKLARHGVGNREIDVSCTCHTHCLIYISTARERVTDCTAKTCCGTAERLDLCRMVVCLVLELEEPLLSGHLTLVVHDIHINVYAACIILFADLHIIKKAL